VSVVLAIEELDEIWAKATVSSALDQLYPRVELVAAAPERGKVDAGAIGAELEGAGRGAVVVADGAPRVGALRRIALDRARGEYVVLVAHGDRLAPTAILRAIELLERVDADLVYTDEDTVDEFERHDERVSKPYWCPDLGTSPRYPGDMCLLRRALLTGTPAELEPDAAPALVSRLAAAGARIAHLPECLYHRMRALRPAAAATEPPVPATAEGDTGRVSAIVLPPGGGDSAVNEQLRAAGVADAIFIADESGGEAASRSTAANANVAAERAAGELLLFVDGRADLSGSAPGWLTALAALAARDGAGAVGGEVRDADGRALQAGLRPGLGALAGPWWDTRAGAPLAGRTCNPIALGLPYVIRRDAFESLGGFDAARLPSSLFDADLALRASRAGLRNVCSPLTQATIPAAPTATDEELAHLVRAWSPELSVIGAYDRAALAATTESSARATSEARTVLGPDRRPYRLGRALTLTT
jgi:hypothetical protein